MDAPIDGMKTRPYGEEYMVGFWLGSVMWAARDNDSLDVFKAETGHDLRSILGQTPIDAMIDDATGRTKEIITAFADWVTANVWGVEGEEMPDMLEMIERD